MYLGYNTNGFGCHALGDSLKVIAGLGYQSVAITLDHSALNPYAHGFAGEVSRIGKLLEELGLLAVVETGARFLLDPWNKHRPTLLEDERSEREVRKQFLCTAVAVARDLGSPVVSMWSGKPPPGITDRADLDTRLLDGLGEVCRSAQTAGVAIGFEPEPGMHIESMADFDRIATQIDDPAFALTLDVGHAHLTEDSAVATVRKYIDRTVNVHIEGMRRPDHDHLVPWEGDLDVKEVLGVLRECGYQGPATFELSRHSHAATETARRAFEFASQAV